VPARNEAEVLPQTLPTLLAQDYPGELAVWFVDDGSSDGTAALARTLAGRSTRACTLLSAAPPPPGWTGKVNALQCGVVAAGAAGVDVLLLTDADIAHHPSSVRRLVAAAMADDRDVISLMALLHTQTGWERALVPAFVYFFAQLYPFSLIAEPSRWTAAAAGGCVLLRRIALQRAGGLPRIRNRLIDDVALGRLMKRSGARTWLGFTTTRPRSEVSGPALTSPTSGAWSPVPHIPNCAHRRYCSLAHSRAWGFSTPSRLSPGSPDSPGDRRSLLWPGSARGSR
jgi:hopene-associated glycosyltransferase HpnB